jgi:DNA modification methylase
MWNLMSDIQKKTPFVIAECIVWKKPSALPNNTNYNKLTRLCEFVFILCRKNEIETFNCYKGVSSKRENGQIMYNNHFNYVEAPNNDEVCPIHKATYSTMLCRKLLLLYSKEGDLIYDPFIGTGTTAIACIREKRNYVGSELSERYCEWANKRIKLEQQQLSLF